MILKQQREKKKGILDGVRIHDTPILQGGEVLPGFYDSVYQAVWHHIVRTPSSSDDRLWLEVRNGHPPQEWTDEEVDYLTHNVVNTNVSEKDCKAIEEELESEDDVKPIVDSVEIIVLSSSKEWPYMWAGGGDVYDPDIFITKEIERAWRVIRDDVSKWCSCKNSIPPRSVLIGTPGIGKSMAAGSYLLYQLLHDVEVISVVAYFTSDKTYIFDKVKQKVTQYSRVNGKAMVEQLCDRNGFVIFDCKVNEEDKIRKWGTVVISSPNEYNYKLWSKQVDATDLIINCPQERDIKAMCAWQMRTEPVKLPKYWVTIKDRILHIGPILRHIFTYKSFEKRDGAIRQLLLTIDKQTVAKYYDAQNTEQVDSKFPHTIVKITRNIIPN